MTTRPASRSGPDDGPHIPLSEVHDSALAEVIAVGFDRPCHRDRALALAQRLGIEVAQKFRDPRSLQIVVADDEPEGPPRLELRVVEAGHALAGGRGVYADLTKLDTASPAGRSLKSPLFKAVGVKSGVARPRVLDATAGLGEDTWLLAAAGCEVVAVERHPIIHTLLADALARARRTAPDITDRIQLSPCCDAADALRDGPCPVDVVLIDPMFPGAAKRKTAERKPLRVLRWLAGDDTDADKLWPLAQAAADRRVVVKRPRHAPPLAGQAPTLAHEGRGFRFDVYPLPGKT